MEDVWFSPVAERALEQLDADPNLDKLVERIDEALVRLSGEASGRWARRRRWQTPPLWVIPVPWRSEDWVIGWRYVNEQITVEYIGLDTYG